MADINADKFINNMLGEMMYQIVNGQEALPKDQQQNLKDKKPFGDANFFTWCTPGIPVSVEDFAFLKGLRKPVDFEKYKDLPEADKEAMRGDAAYAVTIAMENFSMLVDTVPSKSGMINSLQVWEPQNRISQIYESVLNNCEVADTVPSAEAQERIQKIRAATVETVVQHDAETGESFSEERPSKMVAAYNKYMVEYGKAYATYVDLMSKALTGNAADVQKASILGPQYYAAVTAAYQTWLSAGHKVEYEKMMADLEQLEGISMSKLLADYREIFRKTQRESLLDGSKYSIARIVPASFAESTGWTQYEFNSSHLKSTDTSKSKGYSGGARYGLFGGAKGSYKKVESASNLSFEGVSFKFELGQFPLFVNGIRQDFLLSTKWRIKSQADTGSAVNPGDLLSNGDPANPDGKLFAYPTVILVARNIRISKSIYDSIKNEVTTSGGGSGGFSLGPFSLGASGSYNRTDKNIEITQEHDEIVVPGMQIVGFRNHFFKQVIPNPDKTITKWI
ncbi:MAG: hypothetical protein U0T79_05670 [Ferruginibacter sp.]